MAINQRLNTVIEIGGAVSRTLVGATNKARGQLKGIGGAMDTIKRKQDQIERFDIKGLRETRNKLRGVEHNIAGLSDEIEKSKAKSKAAGLAYRRAGDRVNEMAREMRGAEDPTGAMAHELDQARREASRLEREFNAARRETNGLETQMSGARAEAGRLGRQFEEQRDSARRARGALQDMGVDTRNLANETARLQRRQALLESTQRNLGRMGDRFGNMTHRVGSFARTASVGLGLVGGGLFAVANSTSELGDKAAKTADKLGLQIGALQELRYAAERSGVSSNTMDMAMQRMVRRLAEAKNGTGAAKDAIEELGLSSQALASMTPDEALNEIADALKGVENQSDRVRLAFKFFDSEGVSMVNMLKDGSDGLKQLRLDARLTGYVLSEQAARDAEAFQDSLLNAKLGMMGFKNTIGAAIMPVITDMMGEMSVWLRENRDQVIEFSRRLATGLRDAVPVIGQVVKGLTTTVKTIGSATATVAEFVGGYENLGMIVGTVFAGKAIVSVLSLGASLASTVVTVFKLGYALAKFALVANPIGLVVGAIAAIGAGLYLAYNKVEWFREAVDGAFNAVVASAKAWGAGFMNEVNKTWEAAKWVGGQIISFAAKIGTGFVDGFKLVFSLPSRIIGAFSGVGDSVLGMFSGIKNTIVGFIDSIVDRIGSVIDKFSSLKNVGSTVKGWFSFGDDEEPAKKPPKIGQAVEQSGFFSRLNPFSNDEPVKSETQQRVKDATAQVASNSIVNNQRSSVANSTVNDQRSAKTEHNYTITNNITVNQQPGQDGRQLAAEIERILRQKMRGSLSDQPSGAF